MTNMSYCRWQNTAQDLQDCYDNLNETDWLSKDEYRARKRLFKLAQLIVEEFDDVEYQEEADDDDQELSPAEHDAWPSIRR